MILRWDMPGRLLRSVRRGLWRFIFGQGMFAKPATIRQRTAQCLQCQFRVGQQCQICGCHIYSKATMQWERCPATPPRWIDVAE